MKDKNTFSVVVPVFNKHELTDLCLRHNLKHCSKPHHWIIIDNGSDEATKQTLQTLKSEFENQGHRFQIITNSQNLGVSKAWNQGIKAAEEDNLCILNNDAVMQPNWDELAIEAQKKFGLDLFSPFVIEPQLVSHSLNLNDFLGKEFSSPKAKKFNHISLAYRNQNNVRKGPFGGVIMMGKLSNFQKVGDFDEEYWLSCEDYDYMIRALNLNLRIGIAGNFTAWHFSKSSRGEKMAHETENQRHFEAKWGWNLEKNEHTARNKYTRSLQKAFFKWFGLLSTLNQTYPHNS